MIDETVLDLYSGMGGLSCGFDKYFNVIDAVDFCADACKTYSMNHKETNVHNSTVVDFLDLCIPKDFDGFLFSGIIGGPPCQEFSILNQSPDLRSCRAHQLFVFLQAVEKLKPSFALIENVATLPKLMKEKAADMLRKLEYHVVNKEIRAYDYGSVQVRRRWVLTACKKGNVFPNPIPNKRTAKEILRKGKPSYMTMKQEIKDQLITLPKGKWVALPGKHWKEYYIVDPNKPLPAIVNVLKNRIVRPDCSGYVSLDEIKLAQGFHENYIMEGSLTSRAQQLANAVPVELSRSFAKAFFKTYHPDQGDVSFFIN